MSEGTFAERAATKGFAETSRSSAMGRTSQTDPKRSFAAIGHARTSRLTSCRCCGSIRDCCKASVGCLRQHPYSK